MSINTKVVYQYDLDGNFVAMFPSVALASKLTGVNSKSISAVARHRQRTANGYVWSYRLNTMKSEAIVGTCLTSGQKFAFGNPTTAYQMLGVRSNDIQRVITGTRNVAGGFAWTKTVIR